MILWLQKPMSDRRINRCLNKYALNPIDEYRNGWWISDGASKRSSLCLGSCPCTFWHIWHFWSGSVLNSHFQQTFVFRDKDGSIYIIYSYSQYKSFYYVTLLIHSWTFIQFQYRSARKFPCNTMKLPCFFFH